MQCKHFVCSVQCSTFSMKCKCSDSGAFAGAGEVRNVHCAVYRGQCAASKYNETECIIKQGVSNTNSILRNYFLKPKSPTVFLEWFDTIKT